MVGQIAKSAQLSTLAPATILVLSNIFFIFPFFNINFVESYIQISLMILMIITISSLFWLLNGVFLRLLEGYIFEDTSFGRWLANRKRGRAYSLEKEIRNCDNCIKKANEWLENEYPVLKLTNPDSITEEDYLHVIKFKAQWLTRKQRLIEEYKRYFPTNLATILPTKLGNTIAAFEEYPITRYKMDAIVLWPRLLPILEKNGYAKFVEQEKAAFDFLLNLTAVVVILGAECFSLIFLLKQPTWVFGTIIAAVIVLFAYHILVLSAVDWGTTVKVAFDLYRHDLRRSLAVSEPETLFRERELWENASKFFAESDKQGPTSKIQLPDEETWNFEQLRQQVGGEKG
jgi:hypothetical protein